MRHKLALTIALAGFAAVTALGVGMAGADPLTAVDGTQQATPTTALSTTPIPSAQTPACSNGIDDDGDALIDTADPDCASPSGASEAPAPTAGSDAATGGVHSGTTIDGNGAKGGSGNGGVTRNQSIGDSSGGNGANGGVSANGGVDFPSATGGGDQPQTGGTQPTGQFTSGGSPTSSNPTATIAPFGPAPIGVPNFVIDSFEIPPFLLPIYQACGTEYGIPWEVLASINKIETAFGTNLNVSSAGAVGWMQFLPSTWETYGVDANGDGRKDPYNPVDAICAAARYLKAAGGSGDLYNAILAYNHADWYVQEVLLYARAYGKLPQDLVGSLTGLTQGAHFPVAADARYADDISAREALRRSRPGARDGYGNAADVISSSPTRRGINIFAAEGAPVVAVNDGVIEKMGRSEKLGRYIVLQDAYGNRYTYAKLGRIVRDHRSIVMPTGKEKRVPVDSENIRPRLYALPNRADTAATQAVDSATAIGSDGTLKVGSKVIAGTVLARIGASSESTDPHINFSIRPAGRGAPRIDPKPILDGWKLLEATAIYRAKGKNPFARNLGGAGVLLLSKEELEKRVLADKSLSIYECGRTDIATGRIDRRILAMLEYLVAKDFKLTITSLECGHGIMTASGYVSEHSTGDAVDIAVIDGVPVTGHQGPGTMTDELIRTVLQLQGNDAPPPGDLPGGSARADQLPARRPLQPRPRRLPPAQRSVRPAVQRSPEAEAVVAAHRPARPDREPPSADGTLEVLAARQAGQARRCARQVRRRFAQRRLGASGRIRASGSTLRIRPVRVRRRNRRTGRSLSGPPGGEGEESVLVVETLGAPPPPSRRRRRPRPAQPGAEPASLPLTRATAVRAFEPFADERDAARWLDEAAEAEDTIDVLVEEGIGLLNRALHAHAAASGDPRTHELSPELAVAVRIGYGSGDEVAAGRFAAAREVDVWATGASRRRRRAEDLRPQERTAAVLGGRERIDACETLLLRARADLNAGRDREAALQLRVGLEALLAELAGAVKDPGHDEDMATLAARRSEAGDAANMALKGELDEERRHNVRELQAICERVLRRRRVLRG